MSRLAAQPWVTVAAAGQGGSRASLAGRTSVLDWLFRTCTASVVLFLFFSVLFLCGACLAQALWGCLLRGCSLRFAPSLVPPRAAWCQRRLHGVCSAATPVMRLLSALPPTAPSSQFPPVESNTTSIRSDRRHATNAAPAAFHARPPFPLLVSIPSFAAVPYPGNWVAASPPPPPASTTPGVQSHTSPYRSLWRSPNSQPSLANMATAMVQCPPIWLDGCPIDMPVAIIWRFGAPIDVLSHDPTRVFL